MPDKEASSEIEESTFDYEVIAECTYEVEDRRDPTGVGDCGEPAAYYVWWGIQDKKMPVCQEHFDFIMEGEGVWNQWKKSE